MLADLCAHRLAQRVLCSAGEPISVLVHGGVGNDEEILELEDHSKDFKDRLILQGLDAILFFLFFLSFLSWILLLSSFPFLSFPFIILSLLPGAIRMWRSQQRECQTQGEAALRRSLHRCAGAY